MAKLFANSGDLDQMLHSAASDLSLLCLPVTHLRVSRLRWLNREFKISEGVQIDPVTLGIQTERSEWNSVDPEQMLQKAILFATQSAIFDTFLGSKMILLKF